MQRREQFLRRLQGEGLEIGALDNPVLVPHLHVHYVDRITREQAFEHYPELRGHDLVEADVIDDAEVLTTVPDATQDFVIANHVIEHLSNPIKALLTWARVLKTGGRIFLAVPDKRMTFDKERQKTSLDHLFDDYRAPDAERDFEHFLDFAEKVSCRHYHVRPESEARQLAQELWEKKYSIHYHVWDDASFTEFLEAVLREFPQSELRIEKKGPTLGNECVFVLAKGKKRLFGLPFIG